MRVSFADVQRNVANIANRETMQLSKSDYMDYLRHPALLWLKKHDESKLPPIDDATRAMFETGHRFEAYGEALFTGGATLGFRNYDE